MTTDDPAATHAPLTPGDRSTEFVPIEGGAESTSAEHLLVGAYLLMWAALALFLFLTWRRQSRVETRLAELHATLDRVARKG